MSLDRSAGWTMVSHTPAAVHHPQAVTYLLPLGGDRDGCVRRRESSTGASGASEIAGSLRGVCSERPAPCPGICFRALSRRAACI